MKKITALILVLSILAAFCGCGQQEEARTMLPEQLAEQSEEALKAHLTGLSEQTIHEAWGEPDDTLSGFWGDIYQIPNSEKQIILYYDEDGLIENVILIDQVKSE